MINLTWSQLVNGTWSSRFPTEKKRSKKLFYSITINHWDLFILCGWKKVEFFSRKNDIRKKLIFIRRLRIDYVNVVQVLWTIRWANLCTTKDAHCFLFNVRLNIFTFSHFLPSFQLLANNCDLSYCRLSCVVYEMLPFSTIKMHIAPIERKKCKAHKHTREEWKKMKKWTKCRAHKISSADAVP